MDRTLSLSVKFAALDKLTAPLRRMGAGARSASKDLAATKREVLQLERSAGKIGGFRDLQGQIAKTEEEAEQARRRITALKTAIEAADGPTGRLARSLEAAEGKLGRLEARTTHQTARLGKLGDELREAGVDVGKLTEEEKRLGDAIAGANRRMEEQQARIDRAARIDSRVEKAKVRGAEMRATGAGMVAAGVAAGAPMIALANRAAEFRSNMADIQIAANLTARETDRIAANLIRLGPVVAQLPDNLRQGLGTLVTAGLDPRVAQRLLEPIGRTATAQKAEVDDLANASFAAVNNLKVPVGQVERALDAMTMAGKTGGVEIRDMAKSFPTLTAAAAGLGQKGVGAVADLAAALQIAKNGAGSPDEAANNVLNVLNKINTKDTIDNFEKFGVDLPKALKKAYRDGKTPLEAIAELTNTALKGDLSRLPFLFGDAQVQAGLRPLIADLEKYRTLRRQAMAGGGVNRRDFATRVQADPTAQAAQASARMSHLANVVGNALNPALLAGKIWLGEMAEGLATWMERNQGVSQAIAWLATGLVTLVTAYGALRIVLGTVGPIFAKVGALFSRGGPLLMRLGPALRLFGGLFGWIARAAWIAIAALAAFLGIPVWLVAAIGIAIAAAGVLIYRNWDRIKQTFTAGIAFLTGLWGRARSAGANVVRGIVSGVASMLASASSAFKGAGAMMLRGLVLGLHPAILVAHVLRLGKLAIAAIKAVLGIKSPSRVFAQVGGHIMGGLDIGLSRNAKRPIGRLATIGGSLAAAIAMPASGADIIGRDRVSSLGAASATPLANGQASSRSSSQAPIHIGHLTINARPGQDGAELARQFRAELAKVERERRVGRDSSYEDRD